MLNYRPGGLWTSPLYFCGKLEDDGFVVFMNSMIMIGGRTSLSFYFSSYPYI